VECLCSKFAITQSWVKRTSMQESAIQNIVAQKCWPNDVSTILFTDEKIGLLDGDHAEIPTEWPTDVQIFINQEERRCDKTLVNTISVTLRQFDTCWSRSQGYWGVLLYRDAVIQTVPAHHVISQAGSSCSSALTHRVLDAINVFLITLPNVERFKKFFQTDTAVNL